MKKEYRIKRSQDFDNIIRKKQSFANRQFVIYYQNNKIKRYIRETFKTRKNYVKNYEIIIIARAGVKELPFLEVGSSIDHVLKKSKLIEKEKRVK